MQTDGFSVAHINEVAGVPSTLVAAARAQNLSWDLRRIPPGRGNPVRVLWSRLCDLIAWRKESHKYDLLHLHFATNGYMVWGKRPFIVHLHGSDIRRDWQKPGLRQIINKTLRDAQTVICATPDLLGWVREIRPDAVWLPNPVPQTFLTPLTTAVTPAPGRIVFSSRWDSTKGVELLIPLAKRLISDGFEVHGLDWGSDAAAAGSAGVVLHPLMSAEEFQKFLASAEAVVGQLKFPAFSMTDYQTMAVGRPLIAMANEESAPVFTFDARPADPSTITDQVAELAEIVKAALGTDATAAKAWVKATHSPDTVLQQLLSIYERVSRNPAS
ncbi:glycosyltransferase [Canibacter zhoujuaniae]|uniref:glycosyltransferase n=1 Tax=Canibacter zhoujuaniae TaxID=2708343 RepID=UPI0014209B58|nr:glycosyltransferase [Canibacter zhoujuaniae]